MCDYVQEEEWPATAVDLDRACCFASGERVLLTSGIHDNFTGIAPGQLLNHLRQLRRQGMTNPVVIGAIPFDTRAPWHLVIPEQWQWIARERLLPSCHCQLHGKVREVTDAAQRGPAAVQRRSA